MIAEQYQKLSEKLSQASQSGLGPLKGAGPVQMMGASKTHGEATLRAAIEAGITLFGENRVQEAKEKWPALKSEFPNVRLELIGPLQSNKAKEAVALFDRIQTVDRESIVAALAKEMDKQGRHIPVLIQVNTGEEPQKGGVSPAQAPALIKYAREAGLRVEGLMCIPPAAQNPGPHFALLRQMAEADGLCELSMGMSSDFEEAAKFGATVVRVGSALFGSRA